MQNYSTVNAVIPSMIHFWPRFWLTHPQCHREMCFTDPLKLAVFSSAITHYWKN